MVHAGNGQISRDAQAFEGAGKRPYRRFAHQLPSRLADKETLNPIAHPRFSTRYPTSPGNLNQKLLTPSSRSTLIARLTIPPFICFLSAMIYRRADEMLGIDQQIAGRRNGTGCHGLCKSHMFRFRPQARTRCAQRSDQYSANYGTALDTF